MHYFKTFSDDGVELLIDNLLDGIFKYIRSRGYNKHVIKRIEFDCGTSPS